MWKKQCFDELGIEISPKLNYIPVDFEINSWWKKLQRGRFAINKPTLVAFTGVGLNLTRKAISSILKLITILLPGSKLVISFYLPIELMEDDDKPLQKIAEKELVKQEHHFSAFLHQMK